MPVTSQARRLTLASVLPAALAALGLLAVLLPDSSQARWGSGAWSYKHASNCDSTKERIDPIGAIFHGTAAHWGYIGSYDAGHKVHHGHIERHTEWLYEPGKSLQDMNHSGSCYRNIGSMGKEKSRTLNYHARFWEHVDPPRDSHGKHSRVPATPHMDEHDKGPCDGDHVPKKMRLPVGGTGSGYDFARQRLYLSFKTGDHKHSAYTEYWGNTAPVNQCGGKYQVRGSGHVSIIRVGRK